MKTRYYTDFTETFYYNIKIGDLCKADEISLDGCEVIKNSSLYYGAKNYMHELRVLENKAKKISNDVFAKSLIETEIFNKRLAIQQVVRSNVTSLLNKGYIELEFDVQDVFDAWKYLKDKKDFKGQVNLCVLKQEAVKDGSVGVVFEGTTPKIQDEAILKSYLTKYISEYEDLEERLAVVNDMVRSLGFALRCTYKVDELTDGGVRVYGDLDLLYAGVDYDDMLDFEVYNQVYVALKMFLQQCRSCYLI